MLIAAVGQYFFGIAIFLSSMFLIMLVLVQRGRGGGLAGALGGPGGQSAFGTKAGDLFTRITIGVAAFWIFLCVVAVLAMKERRLDTGVTRTTDSSIGSMNGGDFGGDVSPGGPLPGGLTPGATNGVTPRGGQTPDGDVAPATGTTVPPPSPGSAPIELDPADPATGAAEVSEFDPTGANEAPENSLRSGHADGDQS
jgi:preprotein translocase subunit SecG